MKLYIWVDPYNVSYGHSMVYAVAENLREAKKAAREGKVFSSNIDFSDAKRFPDYQHRRNIELKEPNFVYDLPCAVWSEWAE